MAATEKFFPSTSGESSGRLAAVEAAIACFLLLEAELRSRIWREARPWTI